MLGLDPGTLIIRVVTLVIALTFHELAHAWTATMFGDNTPRANGRLSLNPLRHLDPLGSILLLVGGFGWAKPVPVNPYAMRRPSDLMWVSLAGPFSNFLLAILAAIPIRLNLVPYSGLNAGGFPSLFEFLYTFILINLSLMLFNLIPIAPLDGEKIAAYSWPPSWQKVLAVIGPYGPYLLLLVVFVGHILRLDVLGSVITPVLINLLSLLFGGPVLGG